MKLAASFATLCAATTAMVADANTLYVGPQGMWSTGCTEAAPCATIQEAVDTAQEGDTVKVLNGVYWENVYIKTPKLTLEGEGAEGTKIGSAGGRRGATGNAGNPLEAVVEVRAPGVTVKDLNLVIGTGTASKRDAGLFVWPGSDGFVVKDCVIERNRDGRIDEPTVPGSRGIFLLLSPNSVIKDNTFLGNFEDHIHLPTGNTRVKNNHVHGASRAGIAVIDPNRENNAFPSQNNVIKDNTIADSLDVGIHIQGDFGRIVGNTISGSGRDDIFLCGPADTEIRCYPPGVGAVAENNLLRSNTVEGSIGDFGADNTLDGDSEEDSDEGSGSGED